MNAFLNSVAKCVLANTCLPHHAFRVVRFLVHKYPPSLTDEDENGNTPLHLAALHGRIEVASFLIDKGAEVDAK